MVMHKRTITKLRSSLKTMTNNVIDQYTGFTEKASNVTLDRYGFITTPELADPMMPENYKVHQPYEYEPYFIRRPGVSRLSTVASGVYDDLPWYQVNQDWNELDVDWEDTITSSDID